MEAILNQEPSYKTQKYKLPSQVQTNRLRENKRIEQENQVRPIVISAIWALNILLGQQAKIRQEDTKDQWRYGLDRQSTDKPAVSDEYILVSQEVY